MKNKWKWFLFLLIFVISVGLVWYFFIRQPKAQILDEIKDGKNYIEKLKTMDRAVKIKRMR